VFQSWIRPWPVPSLVSMLVCRPAKTTNRSARVVPIRTSDFTPPKPASEQHHDRRQYAKEAAS
jgi:hypothetical protein